MCRQAAGKRIGVQAGSLAGRDAGGVGRQMVSLTQYLHLSLQLGDLILQFGLFAAVSLVQLTHRQILGVQGLVVLLQLCKFYL